MTLIFLLIIIEGNIYDYFRFSSRWFLAGNLFLFGLDFCLFRLRYVLISSLLLSFRGSYLLTFLSLQDGDFVLIWVRLGPTVIKFRKPVEAHWFDIFDVFRIKMVVLLPSPLAVHVLDLFVGFWMVSLRCDFLDQRNSRSLHYLEHWNLLWLKVSPLGFALVHVSSKTVTNLCICLFITCLEAIGVYWRLFNLLGWGQFCNRGLFGSEGRYVSSELTIFEEIAYLPFDLLPECIFAVFFLRGLYIIVFLAGLLLALFPAILLRSFNAEQ